MFAVISAGSDLICRAHISDCKFSPTGMLLYTKWKTQRPGGESRAKVAYTVNLTDWLWHMRVASRLSVPRSFMVTLRCYIRYQCVLRLSRSAISASVAAACWISLSSIVSCVCLSQHCSPVCVFRVACCAATADAAAASAAVVVVCDCCLLRLPPVRTRPMPAVCACVCVVSVVKVCICACLFGRSAAPPSENRVHPPSAFLFLYAIILSYTLLLLSRITNGELRSPLVTARRTVQFHGTQTQRRETTSSSGQLFRGCEACYQTGHIALQA